VPARFKCGVRHKRWPDNTSSFPTLLISPDIPDAVFPIMLFFSGLITGLKIYYDFKESL
jgi:hypothetical protein